MVPLLPGQVGPDRLLFRLVWAHPHWETLKAVVTWWRLNTSNECQLTADIDGGPWTRIAVVTPGPTGKPWERRYAIWNETGALYRVDQLGAVADEPIEVQELP
jgi:hypothetical protein